MGLCDINGNSISINTSGSIITGQKICIIGDSNMQYSGNVVKEYLESNYGCTVSVLATAGSTWEINSSGDNYSGIGRVNSLIANADGETKLCSDYDKVIIMLGTNCNSEGETTDTSEQTDTMCGAIRYCLEQLAYYYRKGKVGVILPPQRADGNSWQEPRNEKIKTICDEYSVKTLDLFHEGQIIPDSKTPDGSNFYLSDGLHFGVNGQIQFCISVGKFIAYSL